MFFVIIATLLLAGCSPKVDADKFLIEGRVENIPDSVAIITPAAAEDVWHINTSVTITVPCECFGISLP